MSDKKITVTRTVDAEPDQLFAILATPGRHQEVDGSGMLQGIDGDDATLGAVGDAFVMRMNNDALGDYQMRSTVVVFEPGRTIGWAPELHPADGYTDKVGDMEAKGHTFTWVLEPAGDGRTTVTQTYDWTGVTDEKFVTFFPMLDAEVLTSSIDRLAAASK